MIVEKISLILAISIMVANANFGDINDSDEDEFHDVGRHRRLIGSELTCNDFCPS
jgi:hypothetical protein